MPLKNSYVLFPFDPNFKSHRQSGEIQNIKCHTSIPVHSRSCRNQCDLGGGGGLPVHAETPTCRTAPNCRDIEILLFQCPLQNVSLSRLQQFNHTLAIVDWLHDKHTSHRAQKTIQSLFHVSSTKLCGNNVDLTSVCPAGCFHGAATFVLT